MNETDRFGDLKIDTAKIILSNVLDKIPNGTTNVSLMAYDNCQTKVLVPPSNTNMGRVKTKVMSISPVGKTPVAKSLHQAGEIMGNNAQPTTIILISDGEETCGGDPCAVARQLKQNPNIELKIYSIGYSVGNNTRRQLQCVADAGEGKYFGVEDSFSLSTAVHKIVKEEVTKHFDEDLDGIANKNDRCSKTLDRFSVDKSGCETSYTIPTPFETGVAEIKPEFLAPSIQQVVDYMETHPKKKVQIQGHTDGEGSEQINQTLSEQRAKFLRLQLIKQGVPPKRLSSVGFGEERPIGDNSSPLGRQKNRRVEVHIVN